MLLVEFIFWSNGFFDGFVVSSVLWFNLCWYWDFDDINVWGVANPTNFDAALKCNVRVGIDRQNNILNNSFRPCLPLTIETNTLNA